jgi:hypothetical protein
MRRRTFCKTAIATAVVAALPACSRSTTGTAASATSSTIDAVSSTGEELSLESAAVGELAESLTGQLHLQSDDGYDTARKIWNGMFDHKRPAMIAECQSVEDIRNAVTFAKERNLLISVKGGGHSLPGKSTCDGGMMIDLSQMHGTDVDTDAKTIRIEGGALLGHLDNAALEHGLMTTTGIVSHTGVGGFTLGGGYGRVDRLFGLAIDNVLAATIVTASGEVVTASENENADLFWGLRGGGGNFGIATEFIYQAHPFDVNVYGGTLVFELSHDLLKFYADFAQTVADEANIEPGVFITEDGTRMVGVEVVYTGDHKKGEQVLAPLLSFPGRVDGELGAKSYRDIQTADDAFMSHGRQYYLKSGLLTELTPEVIEIMIEHLMSDNPSGAWFQHLGGAISRVDSDATAYSHRNAALNVGIMYIGDDPAANEAGIANARRFYSDLAPHMSGFYTNLNDDTERKTWGNYGENYPRLSALKAKYDPTNLFRLNANIRPAA